MQHITQQELMMTREMTIIKRDGSREPFNPNKLNSWAEWASNTLGSSVDWTSIVTEAVSDVEDEITSTSLQARLINQCVYKETWSYNLMAGRLYAPNVRKDIFPDGLPTIKDLQSSLVAKGYMVDLGYTPKEYAILEGIIDHSKDMTYTHYQLFTHIDKYSINDRVSGRKYETSQYMYMRMAMAICEDFKGPERVNHVIKLYGHLSDNRLSLPTPNHINLGTPLRGYASCCVYATNDTAESIGVGDYIAYTMTYSSAGIGANLQVRSLQDPVRGGVIPHQGKLPYYRTLSQTIKSNLQNGRGGAATVFFSAYDPEVETLLVLKNPTSTEAGRIRGLDYAIGYTRHFARKAARGEDIFLFNIKTAPDLQEALYNEDETIFEELYNKYENDPNFPKKYVSAREILILSENQWNETGRVYEQNLYETNRHTPFLDPIRSSNLCMEISLPTAGYDRMSDLLTDDLSVNGEVAICNLAGISVDRIKTEEEYESVAYYALLAIDKVIHLTEFVLPNVGAKARARLSAGVGILGLAHDMASKRLKYSSPNGRNYIHTLAERHAYYLIKASLKLGQELGNAPWIDRTKWPKGWLPIDTYNRKVDEYHTAPYRYDWETLRANVIENGGIRNSAIMAHMPTETSANAAGTTNGLYPIRDISIIKKDADRLIPWVAPNSDDPEYLYERSWDITNFEMTQVYSIVQKFTDQSISADFYRVVDDGSRIDSSELVKDYLNRVSSGLKTKYYLSQRNSDGSIVTEVVPSVKSVASYDEESSQDCSGGGCTL